MPGDGELRTCDRARRHLPRGYHVLAYIRIYAVAEHQDDCGATLTDGETHLCQGLVSALLDGQDLDLVGATRDKEFRRDRSGSGSVERGTESREVGLQAGRLHLEDLVPVGDASQPMEPHRSPSDVARFHDGLAQRHRREDLRAVPER